MSSNKRYYWLKLNENFFEDDTIQWLEEQENGKDYVIFYLKLCLKALSDDGKLIRYVGEKLIPYDVKALAKLTNTSADTVAVAMKAFIEIGLIEQLDTGEIYMKQIDEMIGTETHYAVQKRRQRALKNKKKELGGQSPDNVLNSPPEIDIEIEKEIEVEAVEEKQPTTTDTRILHTFYQKNFGVESPFIAESIEYWVKDLNTELVLEAMKRASLNNSTFRYAEAIMQNWYKHNVRTLEQVEAQDMAFSKKNQKEEPKTEYANDWKDMLSSLDGGNSD